MSENNAQKTLFNLTNVSFSNQGKTILSEISLEIYKHEITMIAGPSGAGKSTFLKLLNGLISATTGSLNFENKPLDDYDPVGIRARILLVGQTPFITAGSAHANILLPFSFKSNQDKTASSEKLITILKSLGLDDSFLSKDSARLSGGEQQRLALARALLLEPEILLLDEPTAALDVLSQSIIIESLSKLRKKISMVIIAHSPAFIELADRIVLLRDGQVVKCAEIFSEDDLKICLEGEKKS